MLVLYSMAHADSDKFASSPIVANALATSPVTATLDLESANVTVLLHLGTTLITHECVQGRILFMPGWRI